VLAWLLIGALTFACAALAVEGYLLLGRQRLLLQYAAQLLGTSADLLALVPSKSAPRTDGADEQPRRWWQRLTLSALTVEVGDDTDAPSTDIRPAVDVVGGARLRPSPRPRGRHRADVTGGSTMSSGPASDMRSREEAASDRRRAT
jgi:hypothetical protein